MATILNGDLTRESTVKIDDREIHITLTANQKVNMRLKGMKSGAVEIGIEDLYNQLRGSTPKTVETTELAPAAKGQDLSSYKGDPKLVISINDIRSAVMVSGMDLETTHKFDAFLSELIRERLKRQA